MTGCSGECCFGVMYGERYDICDFVVFSVVEVCVDYGDVNVFHVCLDFSVVGPVLFEVHRCMQLNRWSVVCGCVLHRGERGGVFRRLCVGMRLGWDFYWF